MIVPPGIMLNVAFAKAGIATAGEGLGLVLSTCGHMAMAFMCVT